MDPVGAPSLIVSQNNFGFAAKVAPPPGIDPGPWASKAHVLATTQWRNPYSPVSAGMLLTTTVTYYETW